MKYILGIDSGGTKYLVRACTPEGGVVAEYVGPPAPHYRLEREEVIKRVNANIDACLAKVRRFPQRMRLSCVRDDRLGYGPGPAGGG